PLPTAGFLLGVLMGTRIEHMALFSQIRTLRDILLVVFFFMLGVSVSSISFALVFVALCVALLVMAVKFTMTYVFVTILKMHPKHSFSVGFDLMQCGEFGFIILLLLFRGGMLSAYQKDVLLMTIMVTLIVYVFSDQHRLWFYQLVKRLIPLWLWPRAFPVQDLDVVEERMENHIILCGYGRVGSYIGHTLHISGIPFVVIDTDAHHIQALLHKGIKALYGDAEEVELLRRADVATARFVIVAVPDHVEQENIILLVKRLNPKATIVARSHLQRNIRHLRTLGIEYIVHPEFEASLTILKRILKLYNQTHDDIKKHIHYLKIEHGMGEE
ncbi:MAG: NAD-binding protein, partial [Patescibacteria group bacterium]